MDYEQLCERIFDLHGQIRFAAIFNDKFEKIAGGMRKDTETLTPSSITRLSVEQSFSRWTTRLQMGEYIGMPKYAIAEYEKLKRFTFHVDDDKLLLVSTELEVKSDFLVEAIRKLI